MAKNDNYSRGYADGYTRVARNLNMFLDDDYEMGYDDGEGDRLSGNIPDVLKSSFIDSDFHLNNDPPEGYVWGELRVPQKGEVYFTKAGNPGVAKDHPKNNRMRHMLIPLKKCNSYGDCRFDINHSGQCSYRMVK